MEHSSIGGVASGLADFFDMDVTIFRVLFIITTIFAGGGLVLYAIIWIVVPPKPVTVESRAEVMNDSTITSQTESVADIKTQKGKKTGAITGGLVLIAIGVIFLINIFTDLAFRDIWPIVVIALGVIIVISGFVNKKSQS